MLQSMIFFAELVLISHSMDRCKFFKCSMNLGRSSSAFSKMSQLSSRKIFHAVCSTLSSANFCTRSTSSSFIKMSTQSQLWHGPIPYPFHGSPCNVHHKIHKNSLLRKLSGFGWLSSILLTAGIPTRVACPTHQNMYHQKKSQLA